MISKHAADVVFHEIGVDKYRLLALMTGCEETIVELDQLEQRLERLVSLLATVDH